MRQTIGDLEPRLESPPRLRFARELPLTRAARVFAEQRHAGQLRAVDGAPFLIHPLEVASLLEREGYPDHVVAAAVLHDVLEDTDTQRSELTRAFGTAVERSCRGRQRRPWRSPTKRHARTRCARVCDTPAVSSAGCLRRRQDLEGREFAGGCGGLDRRKAEAKLLRYTQPLAMLESELAGKRMVGLLRLEME